ncbi:restriction endonuclease subunit S [Maribacter dokdonensis]|uniref:restriction endonuclease subunit S n=1 Tax=Maribacter dokdonensis TaxID=320912 RepID=UPI002AB2AB47|nr:restriction endonuclease subunit S [Maribacter dokdonensis]
MNFVIPAQAGIYYTMKLLKHFKELTIRPKNAEELKGLILQLAIQGKLTANWRNQNSDIEPASELLKRIQKEKEQLVKDKKIRKEKELPAYSKDEIPYEIPEIWIWSKLGTISQIIGGGTPKTSNPEYFCEEGISWFTPADLGKSKSKYLSNGRRDITELGLQKSSAQLMPKGSVMFSSRAPIGHTAIGLKDFSTNQGFKSSVPFLMEMNEYIYLYLNSIVKVANENASGTTFKEVSGTIVKNFLFPLPPLEEQKEIVRVVETLFKEVEQLEQSTVERIGLKEDFVTSALHQLTTNNAKQEWTFLQDHFKSFFNETTNIKKLRETVLQLAVQGKLTADWRQQRSLIGAEVEDASQLLKRIQEEKAQLIASKKIKKEKALPPIGKEEIPYELPDGWVWCRLNELTELITKGSSPKWQGVQYVEEGEGILFVTSENVGNYNLIWKKKKYVESKFNEIEPRSILKSNDLLMNIVGGSIGRTAIYNIDELANINQAVTIIRLFPKVSYEYFLHFFNSPICISYMYDKQVDNARPNLSMGNIAKFMIPLPSLEEQKAIVKKVNALMGLCDALEQKVQQSQEHSEKLMQSVLREIFEPNKLN